MVEAEVELCETCELPVREPEATRGCEGCEEASADGAKAWGHCPTCKTGLVFYVGTTMDNDVDYCKCEDCGKPCSEYEVLP